MRRVLLKASIALVCLGISVMLLLFGRYGGGQAFPDRSGEALLDWTQVELVAELSAPPGNIAVSRSGQVFITQHPEARPEYKVMQLRAGRATPYPNADSQSQWHTPLSLRIDQQNRLWVLDASEHGVLDVTLKAYDLNSDSLVYDYTFPRDVMGLGSHANDFQISADGRTLYMADASVLGLTPAIVVLDIANKTARRLLEGHDSVVADNYVPTVQGRKMTVAGVFDVKPGVDSIALSRARSPDRAGWIAGENTHIDEWLYFAPVSDLKLYRISTQDLLDTSLSSSALAAKVETYADKTMSDGITTDNAGNVYLSDLEHNAIVRLNADRSLETLLKDQRIRWPDGFSFGELAADGSNWLYFTCSSLQDVIGKLPSNIAAQAPYQVYRVNVGANAQAGH